MTKEQQKKIVLHEKNENFLNKVKKMHHEKSDKSEIWKKVHKNSALECTNE